MYMRWEEKKKKKKNFPNYKLRIREKNNVAFFGGREGNSGRKIS